MSDHEHGSHCHDIAMMRTCGRAAMRTYYRNDTGCANSDCYCKVISSPARLTNALRPCASCGCVWSDEPMGAGRDNYGRPDPQTHPEFWSE